MEDLQYRYNNTSELLNKVIEFYFKENSCACQFPRFLQIVGINCVDYNESFKCWETTLLLNKVREYFKIENLEKGPECSNQKWTCKKCSSIFNFGWSDFSVAVEREVLKPIEIKTTMKGMESKKPIPLYVGLYGHSYPPYTEIESVDFETFKNYILEK